MTSNISRQNTTNFRLPVSRVIDTKIQELPLPLKACGCRAQKSGGLNTKKEKRSKNTQNPSQKRKPNIVSKCWISTGLVVHKIKLHRRRKGNGNGTSVLLGGKQISQGERCPLEMGQWRKRRGRKKKAVEIREKEKFLPISLYYHYYPLKNATSLFWQNILELIT